MKMSEIRVVSINQSRRDWLEIGAFRRTHTICMTHLPRQKFPTYDTILGIGPVVTREVNSIIATVGSCRRKRFAQTNCGECNISTTDSKLGSSRIVQKNCDSADRSDSESIRIQAERLDFLTNSATIMVGRLLGQRPRPERPPEHQVQGSSPAQADRLSRPPDRDSKARFL